MSLDDVFGPFPGRPQHHDMAKLSSIVLMLDGKLEDEDFDMEAFLAAHIDPETLSYVAYQRCLRLANGNELLALKLAASWLDAFIAGYEYRHAETADR